MKKDLHPNYVAEAKVSCSCGAVFATGSTRDELSVETCSQCHPFFTGKQKIIDSTGRVDRFKKMAEAAEAKKADRESLKSKEEKQAERAAKQAKKTEEAINA